MWHPNTRYDVQDLFALLSVPEFQHETLIGQAHRNEEKADWRARNPPSDEQKATRAWSKAAWEAENKAKRTARRRELRRLAADRALDLDGVDGAL